jgi:cell division protein DivIC
VKQIKDRIFAWARRNKVTAGILIFFLVWMMFFDEYNWVRIRRDKTNYKDLIETKEYLRHKIEVDKKKLHQLRTDDEALERFAREEYFLKKENEEVFIIIEK